MYVFSPLFISLLRLYSVNDSDGEKCRNYPFSCNQGFDVAQEKTHFLRQIPSCTSDVCQASCQMQSTEKCGECKFGICKCNDCPAPENMIADTEKDQFFQNFVNHFINFDATDDCRIDDECSSTRFCGTKGGKCTRKMRRDVCVCNEAQRMTNQDLRRKRVEQILKFGLKDECRLDFDSDCSSEYCGDRGGKCTKGLLRNYCDCNPVVNLY